MENVTAGHQELKILCKKSGYVRVNVSAIYQNNFGK